MKIGNFLIMFCAAIIFHGVFLARVRQAGNRLWDFPLELAEQAADFLIQQSQTPFTISQPGIYRLIESLNVTGNTVITISASNVVLDLNSKALAGNTTAIAVVGARSNITIQNGFITGSPFQTGISVPVGCTNIILKNLNMNNFTGASGGISITGSSGIAIRDCFVTQSLTNAATLTLCNDVAISDCNFYANGQYGLDFEQSFDARVDTCIMEANSAAGLRINGSHNIVANECIAYDNTTVGFELIQSNTNCIQSCQALDNGSITGTGSIIEAGFLSLNGIGNIFENCIANATTTTATNAASQVAGFALLGTEQCSKIIKCESSNTTSPVGGSTVPYGILLNATVDNLNTTTSAMFNGSASSTPFSFAWHPNSQLLAIGGTSASHTNGLQLFEYNRTLQQLVLHNTQAFAGDSINSISWSPDGNYLAIGGGVAVVTDIQVYSLDRINKTLTVLSGCNESHGATVSTVAWSPDGQFLAIAGLSSTGNIDARVYKFSTTALTLTQECTIVDTRGIAGLSWSSNGNYLAVAFNDAPGTVAIYAFAKSVGFNALTLLTSQTHGTSIFSVAFSRDNNFVAIGGNPVSGNAIRVYAFNQTTQQLSLVSSQTHGGSVTTVVWSPNDLYLAIAGSQTASIGFRLFKFDRTNDQLEQIATLPASPLIGGMSWSKDGRYILYGGNAFPNGSTFQIINALLFPNNNIIVNNKLYCNVGDQYPGGVGISGSSIQNLIISNMAYQNTFNYEFITNIFMNGIDASPTLLQNISIPPFDEP